MYYIKVHWFKGVVTVLWKCADRCWPYYVSKRWRSLTGSCTCLWRMLTGQTEAERKIILEVEKIIDNRFRTPSIQVVRMIGWSRKMGASEAVDTSVLPPIQQNSEGQANRRWTSIRSMFRSTVARFGKACIWVRPERALTSRVMCNLLVSFKLRELCRRSPILFVV